MKHPFALRALAGAVTLAATQFATASMLITGVIDGPLSGGVPKAVELYVYEDIADLSSWGLESANNGNPAAGAEFTFDAVSASAGDFIYVSSESTGFANFFGFDSDYTSGALSINGDDAIILYENSVAFDSFGEVGTRGTTSFGENWSYQDSWAYRISDAVDGVSGFQPLASGSDFFADEWIFGGANALDGLFTNAPDIPGGDPVVPFGTFSYPPASGVPAPATLGIVALGVASLIARRRSA